MGLVLVVIIGLVCVMAVALTVWAVAAYNRLVRQRNQVNTAWAQVDVQLKRCHDLIPNLVEIVKGYVAYERGTLEAMVQARNTAVAASGQDAASRAEAENALNQTLGRVFALAEAYPNLKPNENFTALQSELGDTEDAIAYAREFYNSAVRTYNTSTQSLPTNVLAELTGFRAQNLFQAVDGERAPVQVRL